MGPFVSDFTHRLNLQKETFDSGLGLPIWDYEQGCDVRLIGSVLKLESEI